MDAADFAAASRARRHSSSLAPSGDEGETGFDGGGNDGASGDMGFCDGGFGRDWGGDCGGSASTFAALTSAMGWVHHAPVAAAPVFVSSAAFAIASDDGIIGTGEGAAPVDDPLPPSPPDDRPAAASAHADGTLLPVSDDIF